MHAHALPTVSPSQILPSLAVTVALAVTIANKVNEEEEIRCTGRRIPRFLRVNERATLNLCFFVKGRLENFLLRLQDRHELFKYLPSFIIQEGNFSINRD